MLKISQCVHQMVLWCSWLSRQSNTLKVSSSSLDKAIICILQIAQAGFPFIRIHQTHDVPSDSDLALIDFTLGSYWHGGETD